MAIAAALVLAGCGGRSAAPSASARARPSPAASPPGPQAWPELAIPAGATMPYPPGWRRVRGDRGTASVMLLGAGGRILGYLNLTPRQGAETKAGWTQFRVEHNAKEGDRHVRVLSSTSGVRFPSGHGSCVRDAYTTSVGTHYIELACLVTGKRSTFVALGAAPPAAWAQVSPDIERAIAGVRG